MSAALTIHSLDPVLSGRISSLAKREGKSRNQTVKDALAEHFGLKPRSSRVAAVAENGIMSRCGILPQEDARELRETLAGFRTVNPEDWK